MNVIFMTNTFTPHVGGVSRSLEAFSSELRARGHQVLVIAPEFPDTPAFETDVIRIPAIQNFNASDFSVALPLHQPLTGKCIEFGAHLIHAHHPFLLGTTAIRLSRALSLPLVFTHHTLYEQYSHYVVPDNQTIELFIANLATAYANLTDRVIAPSESLKLMLRERGVKRPIDVVPTGVRVKAFSSGDGAGFRHAHKIERSTYVVGHMGRLAPEKNLEFLAEAVCGFLKGRPDAVFLLVGKGPSDTTISRIFDTHNLSERLVLCGELENESLAAALNAMDVFAFSSLSETQGMVISEAMAAGVPVVALDAPGVRDVVIDGQNGRLLASHERSHFTSALEFVYTLRPAEKRKLVAGARATAKRFSLRRSTDRLLRCYRSLEPTMNSAIDGDHPTALEPFMSRLRTEWDIFTSYTRAGEEATFNRNPAVIVHSNDSGN
jgi:glycosyltransferase involved in cell wall biosynthesis